MKSKFIAFCSVVAELSLLLFLPVLNAVSHPVISFERFSDCHKAKDPDQWKFLRYSLLAITSVFIAVLFMHQGNYISMLGSLVFYKMSFDQCNDLVYDRLSKVVRPYR